MFIFIRFVLAHFIGDFLLQFDKVHELKVKSKLGLLLHVGIVTACLVLIAWPYLSRPGVWLFILFIGTTHYIQDSAKTKVSERSDKQLLPYCLDQALHIAFLATVFWTDLKTLGAPANPQNSTILAFYSNDAIILYFIAAIFASYMGHYFILIFKMDYLKINGMVGTFEKWYGFMERILVVSAFLPGMPWPALVPAILIVRPLLYRAMMDKLNLSDQFASKPDILLSGLFSIMTGLILYALI